MCFKCESTESSFQALEEMYFQPFKMLGNSIKLQGTTWNELDDKIISTSAIFFQPKRLEHLSMHSSDAFIIIIAHKYKNTLDQRL